MSTFPTSGAYSGIAIPVAPAQVDPVPVRRAAPASESDLENNYTATRDGEEAVQRYKAESIRKREREELLDDKDILERQDIRESMDVLSSIAEKMGRKLRFEKDEASGKLVIKIIDSITGDIIRQVPPEEILEMARKLKSVGRGWVDLVG